MRLVLFFVICSINAHAQLAVDAGRDQKICYDSTIRNYPTVTLGGNPTAVNGTPPYTYEWTPGSLLSDSTIANPIFTGTFTFTNNSFTFTVNVKDANNVINSDTTNIQFSRTSPCFTPNCSDRKNPQDTIMLFPNCFDPDTPVIYHWTPAKYLSDSTSMMPLCWTPTTDTFICTFTDALGCVSQYWAGNCLVEVLPTAIYEEDLTASVSLFPNPTQSTVTLMVARELIGSVYEVAGLDGKLTSSGKIEQGSTLIVPTSNISVIQIKKDGKIIYREKLIKN